MKVKYEVASEEYRNNKGVWELYGTPQQVAMFNTSEAAVKACGPFKKDLPALGEFETLETHTLYELQLDENEDVTNAVEIGYKVMCIVD